MPETYATLMQSPLLSPWVVAEEAARLRRRLALSHQDTLLLEEVLTRLADPAYDAVFRSRGAGQQALWLEMFRHFHCLPNARPGRFCNGPASGSRFMAFLDRDPPGTFEDVCAYARNLAEGWSTSLASPRCHADAGAGVGGGVLDELKLLFSDIATRLPQVRVPPDGRGPRGIHLLLQAVPQLLDGFTVARLYYTARAPLESSAAVAGFLNATSFMWRSVWETLCSQDYPVTALAKALPCEGFLLKVNANPPHPALTLGSLPGLAQSAWLAVLRHPDTTRKVLEAARVSPAQSGSQAVATAFIERRFTHGVPAPHHHHRLRG